MKTKLIATFALTAIAGTYSLTGIAATETAPEAKKWLPISQVLEKVETAGYRDVIEIERDDGQYEVKALNAEGVRTKLYIDRENGEILKTRTFEERKGERERHRKHHDWD